MKTKLVDFDIEKARNGAKVVMEIPFIDVLSLHGNNVFHTKEMKAF